jgi:predicted AAA+ superfamily ATPase
MKRLSSRPSWLSMASSLSLPTSPEGLNPAEIQSILDRLRVLRSTKPAQVRRLGSRLSEFSRELWLESAQAILADEPQAARAIKRRPTATQTRVLLGSIALIIILVSVCFEPLRRAVIVNPWPILAIQFGSIGVLVWAYHSWPHIGELELFLGAPKPSLHYLLGFGNDSQFLLLTPSGELTLQPAAFVQLSEVRNKKLVAFTVNEQWSLMVDLNSAFQIAQARAPFTVARLKLISQEIRRLGATSQSLQDIDRDMLILWQLDDIIGRFEAALRPAAATPGNPAQPGPHNNQEQSWSATQLDAAFGNVIIDDKLRLDLIRRLDRFVSGKMTGCPGLLLHGPSGTGKTSIARALSKLGGLELISVKLPDLKSDIWLGSGAKNVRELWTRARAATSKVLIFIDELDAVFPGRSATESDVLTREIVSAFSAEWDGIEQREATIFVLGATNRLESLDSAIMSRFGAQKEVPLPDKTARKKILMLELTRAGLGDLGLEQLTIETPSITDALFAETAGMSGRDLHKLVEELAISTHPQAPDWEHLAVALLRWGLSIEQAMRTPEFGAPRTDL